MSIKKFYIVFISLTSLFFYSCRSEYGTFIQKEQFCTSRFKVKPTNSFIWEWNTNNCKIYSDGIWNQRQEPDSLWWDIQELANQDSINESEIDSLLKREKEFQWLLYQDYESINNSKRYHFESRVKDIHKFPMYIKEHSSSPSQFIIFHFSNLNLYPNAVCVELHLNDTIYPINENLLRIENQKVDSFRIVMKFIPVKPVHVPYPIHTEISTDTYYPQTKSKYFSIRLYQWELIDRYQHNHPFRVIEYFYYLPMTFDGYYMPYENDMSDEKQWNINPLVVQQFNTSNSKHIRTFWHHRKRNKIIRERLFKRKEPTKVY